MYSFLISILLLISLIASEISAQMLLKTGFKNNINYYLGIGLYGIVAMLFAQSLKYEKFGSLNLLWHLSMVLATLFVGYFIYNESYSIREHVGIVLGIISLGLLLSDKHSH